MKIEATKKFIFDAEEAELIWRILGEQSTKTYECMDIKGEEQKQLSNIYKTLIQCFGNIADKK